MNNNYPTAEIYIRYNSGRITVAVDVRYNTRSKPKPATFKQFLVLNTFVKNQDLGNVSS